MLGRAKMRLDDRERHRPGAELLESIGRRDSFSARAMDQPGQTTSSTARQQACQRLLGFDAPDELALARAATDGVAQREIPEPKAVLLAMGSGRGA